MEDFEQWPLGLNPYASDPAGWGPSLLTNFVDCDMGRLKIGQKVKVVFKTTDGPPLPFFTPVT